MRLSRGFLWRGRVCINPFADASCSLNSGAAFRYESSTVGSSSPKTAFSSYKSSAQKGLAAFAEFFGNPAARSRPPSRLFAVIPGRKLKEGLAICSAALALFAQKVAFGVTELEDSVTKRFL